MSVGTTHDFDGANVALSVYQCVFAHGRKRGPENRSFGRDIDEVSPVVAWLCTPFALRIRNIG